MTTTIPSPAKPTEGLAARLGIVIFARTILNIVHRMVYPFLASFSRGLGIGIPQLTLLLSIRNGLVLLTPIFQRLTQGLGTQGTLYFGMAVFVAGLIPVVIWPSFTTFAIAVLAAVFAKILYDPTTIADFGDRTPYRQRGRIIGLLETSWAIALLAGVPLVGWLLERTGAWNSAFGPLAALGLVSLLALWLLNRRTANQSTATAGHTAPAEPVLTLNDYIRLMFRNPHALAALFIGLLISGANEILNVAYGPWLEDRFNLTLVALGFSSAVIGLAELLSEGGVIALVDRVGVRRSVLGGIFLNAIIYILAPYVSVNPTLALISLFLAYFTFEFAFVAALPLLTQVVPEARAAFLSVGVAFIGVGRMLGAQLGSAAYQLGFAWSGWIAGILNLIAAVVILIWLRESDLYQPESDHH